jgi:hypothetical protein
MRGTHAFACCIVVACGGDRGVAPGDGAPDAPTRDAAPLVVDDDGDGLEDAYELALATDYLPFIALHPDDGCSRSGLVVRVRPHPADATKLLIIYDHLFETDCGLNGHTGDNEAFGVAIDPAIPPPGGILAIKTASHQATLCERVTECSTCSDDSRGACDLAAIGGAMYPVLYASKDKHGQYARGSQCGFGTCFDSCSSSSAPHQPPIVNAGEPGDPLVADLTTQGFITAANGWTKPELMNIDPWAPGEFGSAGNIADDLVDPVFEPDVCR